MKTATITCFGKPVAIYEFGDASLPALIFIHGNSAHSGFFIPMITVLETKYHVITLDLPGHRQSGAWEKEDFTPEKFAFLFNSVLDHFNISEIDAFGFSMGGLILLECFNLIPAIKKIAVAGHPPLSSVTDMPEAYNLNEDSSRYLQGPLSEEEVERIYNAVIAIDDNQIKSQIKQALLETNPLFREGCLNLAQHVGDQIARLNQLQNSITVIHAENDLAIRFDYLKKLKINKLWKHKIQVIAGCGHFMIAEKPLELASMLDQFFSESQD